jgi:hypothetical protein
MSERLKSDMTPPQPSEHPDPRMRLVLSDLYELSKHPKKVYPLVFPQGSKPNRDR